MSREEDKGGVGVLDPGHEIIVAVDELDKPIKVVRNYPVIKRIYLDVAERYSCTSGLDLLGRD